MELIKVWETDREKAYMLFQQFPKNDSGFENSAYGMTREEFVKYLKKKENDSKGIDLQEGYVPSTQYILCDSEENYCGIFNLRHELNDFLRNGPGHIGYGIEKSMRGRGYATDGLKLTLQKAQDIGISEAYLSCNKENLASRHVIEKCGGQYRGETEKDYLFKISLTTEKL